jgi:glycosyltransferase involved in cell wall biosynthesis
VLEGATHVTVGSAYLETLVHAFVPPPVRARVIRAPLGVDIDRFSPGADRSAGRRGVTLNIGSLTPVKNQQLAIAVMARSARGCLEVAGDGARREELASYARGCGVADRVRLLGHVPHDVMPSLFHASSVLLQTSWHEAQGMAVLEAAASGLAVIGTAVGVLPELVPDGWTLPAPAAADGPGSPAADLLASQLAELHHGGRLRRRLSEHGCDVARSRFSLAASVERFLWLYAQPRVARSTSA